MCCCRKKKNRYPTTGEFEGEEIEKNNKHWDGVNDDMNELIEKTMDVSLIFHELSILRMVSRLLLDEKQLELADITSLHIFRKEKEKEKNKHDGESERLRYSEKDKKKRKSISKKEAARRSTLKCIKDIRERGEREGEKQHGEKTDYTIVEAWNGLKLGVLEEKTAQKEEPRDDLDDMNLRGETKKGKIEMQEVKSNRMEVWKEMGDVGVKVKEEQDLVFSKPQNMRSNELNKDDQMDDPSRNNIFQPDN